MQQTLFHLPSTVSPLRYIGSKKKLWKTIKNYIPPKTKTIISPFIGGGSLELQFTSIGLNVIAADIFEPLVNFWQRFLLDANKITTITTDKFPLEKDEITLYQESGIPEELDIDERASLYWLVNKQSFSAATLANKSFGISYVTKDSFNKFKSWQNDYLQVYHADCFDIISKYNNSFMYLDPPYVGLEKLYGQKGTDRNFDHERLYYLLKLHNSPWILSYGDHPKIREMYSEYTLIEPKYNSSMTNNFGEQTEVKELLFLNL